MHDMKKYIISTVAAVLGISAIATISMGAGSQYGPARENQDGHELVSLWKAYEKVRDTDRPDKEKDMLRRIISSAEKKHLPWDFYDAWQQYRNVVTASDWKQRQAADSAMAAAIKDFDEPIVTWSCKHTAPSEDGAATFIKENKDRLMAGRNPLFYSAGHGNTYGQYSFLPTAVSGRISDDYEYALWSGLIRSGGESEELEEMLREYLGGSYPGGAYLDYYMISATEENTGRLQEFAERHRGKAVSLFARQDLLSEKFYRMDNDGRWSSGDFIELRKECGEFEDERAGYRSGIEKEIAENCNTVEKIIERLDDKAIGIRNSEDTLMVLLRNLADVRMEIISEDGSTTVLSSSYTNDRKSYYVYDTIRVRVPGTDDGRYKIRCISGDTEVETAYEQATVSLAYRSSGKDGISVYAADMKSGKPLQNAELEVFTGDSLIQTFENIDFTGFVPFRISGMERDDKAMYISCSYTDSEGHRRSSGKVWIYRLSGTNATAGRTGCRIFKDRSVFLPGDTLRFKTILYANRTEAGNEAMPSCPVKVRLQAPDSRYTDSLSLVTNDFGSAAGSFPIPAKGLNGRYRIEVCLQDGSAIASDQFTVGDIDLPTYVLKFAPCDTIYLPGDEITVSGNIKSYSGHPLSSAKVSWSAHKWPSGISSGQIAPDGNGDFSFSFKDNTEAGGRAYYEITVKVTDITGETLEFHDYIQVESRFSIDARLLQDGYGQVYMMELPPYDPMHSYSASVLQEDKAGLEFTVRNSSYTAVRNGRVRYSVYHANELLYAGTVNSGERIDLDFSGKGSGLYRVEAEASVPSEQGGSADSLLVSRYTYDLIKTASGDRSLDTPGVENLFKAMKGDGIGLQIGTTAGPMWAIVELWGDTPGKPLIQQMLFLNGELSEEGSLASVEYPYKESYPDNVELSVFYFRNGRDYMYSASYSRKETEDTIPLEFSSFTDESRPMTEVSFSLKTAPDAECLVSVFDKSTEQIQSNRWYRIGGTRNAAVPQTYPHNGFISCRWNMVTRSKAVNSTGEEAIPFQYAGGGPEYPPLAEKTVATVYDTAADALSSPDQAAEIRDEFENTIAFIPFLMPDAEGNASFSFRTSGKLSTYAVSVFAHDRKMRNSTLRREMTVTRPVAVSISKPQFLNEGDIYSAMVSVSNNTEADVEGILNIFVYGTGSHTDSDPVMVYSRPAKACAGSSARETFRITAAEGMQVAGVKAVFSGCPEISGAGEWSDGIFISIPVLPDRQRLTESHSAVLASDTDSLFLKDSLMGSFVNTSPYGATWKEISVIDMIKKAIPQKSAVCRNDVVSLSDALYVRLLSGCMEGTQAIDTLAAKIQECQNRDGGFGWFAGMESSPEITSFILERTAELRGRTHGKIINEKSVRKALEYTDSLIFSKAGSGRGYSSLHALARYLHVRSMYPSDMISMPDDRKSVSEFRKKVKELMTMPTGSDMFRGHLEAKIYRSATALNIIGNENLASELGFSKGALKKIGRTMESDIASLCGYAVRHPSGGIYFPNAVMPLRGLTDSELYVHSLACDLLQRYADTNRKTSGSPGIEAAAIADAIRLWMMVQKETQQWESSPAFARAVASVLEGSEAVKNTRILTVSKNYEKPFSEIKKAGNGMAVSREFYRCPDNGSGGRGASDGLQKIMDGDTLHVGERIICRYRIWSAENRSFVRLSVPRYASLRPVDQVSGFTWQWRPYGRGGLAPAGYRDVRTDRTDYYFTALPEEETVIEEEFFVSQAGEFSCGTAETESVYAPHYRANEGFCGTAVSF